MYNSLDEGEEPEFRRTWCPLQRRKETPRPYNARRMYLNRRCMLHMYQEGGSNLHVESGAAGPMVGMAGDGDDVLPDSELASALNDRLGGDGSSPALG